MPEQKLKCLYITFNGLMDPLGQSQILPYVEDLSKKGIKFYLVSLEKVKDLKEIKELKRKTENLGISWYRLKYFKHHPLKMLLNILQCFLLSFYLLIFKKIKIIHARAYPPLFSTLLLKRIFKVKLIFDMRGFWPEELVDSGRITKDSICYKILKFMEKESILSSDWLITLTPEAEEIIKSNYQNIKLKTAWMPTCVDEDRFGTKDLISFNDKFVVVYLGSLWSYYNMPAMIDFFNLLKLKIPNSHFLILANNEKGKLHPLLSEKGLRKEEYTVLNLKPAEVPKYLRSSNLGISFIYDFYSKKASFPTKIAEYLISGLPLVINTQSNFLKRIIASNKVGIVIERFDKEAYEKSIKDLTLLLKDKNLGERCKKIAKKYLAKGVCVEKYFKVYSELQRRP